MFENKTNSHLGATSNPTQLFKHIVKPLVVLVILMLYYQRPSQQFLSHDETEPPCFCFVLGRVLKCLSQGHKHGVGRLNHRLLALEYDALSL